ncbi:MAG: hypothetical protein J6Z00_02105 [Clostridia bacterium]|nr:hypothetical protein [Clostridia bacterium]
MLKKGWFIVCLVTALLWMPVLAVCAYSYESITMTIPIIIHGGGTAVIMPAVNCPTPDKTTVTVADGATAQVCVTLSEVGVYSYTITIKKDSRDMDFDTTVYLTKYYVNEVGGVLVPTTIVYRNDLKYGGENGGADGDPHAGTSVALVFTNRAKDLQEVSDLPDNSEPPENSDSPENSNPQHNVSHPENSNLLETSDVSDTSNSQGEGSSLEYWNPPENSKVAEMSGTEDPGEPGEERIKYPDTGDSTDMERYLLWAMFASMGLFDLALFEFFGTLGIRK